MLSNQTAKDQQQMSRFFRAFELIAEYRMMMQSNTPVLQNLPQLLKKGIEYQFLPYYFSDVPKWRLSLRKLISKDRIAPNYVMTGPGKSGSSDLVSHLLFHPNVIPPLAKEPKMHHVRNWRFGYPTVKEAEQYQASVGGPVRCGYLDPELHRLEVMEHLYLLNPDCKIIITLRDPVSRAYSFYKWEVFIGGKALKKLKKGVYFNSFADYVDRALDLFPSIPMESVSGPQVLANGIYHKAVEHWIKRFGRHNVLVLDIADYFHERQPTLERIQKFLELPVMDIPEYSKKANENPIQLPPPDAQTNAKLAQFYQLYNQRLFDLLGTEFDWQ